MRFPTNFPPAMRAGATTAIMRQRLVMQDCMSFGDPDEDAYWRDRISDAVADAIARFAPKDFFANNLYYAYVGGGGSGKDLHAETVIAFLRELGIPTHKVGISAVIWPLIQEGIEALGITFENRRENRVTISTEVLRLWREDPVRFIAPVVEEIFTFRGPGVVITTGLRMAPDVLICSMLGSKFVEIMPPTDCHWLTQKEKEALAQDPLEPNIALLAAAITEAGTYYRFRNIGSESDLADDARLVAQSIAAEWKARPYPSSK